MAASNKRRLVLGYWTCQYCNTKNIKGSLRDCPNCGNARDDTTRFYLNPQKIEYASEEENRTVNRNPDWICSHCQNLNSANDTVCKSCGSSKDEEDPQYSNFNHYSVDNFGTITPENVSDIKEKDSYHSSSETPTKNIHNNMNLFSSIGTFLSSHKTHIFSAILIVAAIVGLIFLFSPRYYDICVTDFSWERSIMIEKWQTVQENDWSLPVSARLKYTREEFSHYTQVLDHYETKTRQVAKQRLSHYEEYVSGYRDLGNGYFEEVTSSRPVYETYYETETYQSPIYRDEPVYRTKYYYEIDKWLPERSVKTKGTDKNPFWGEPKLSNIERISNKLEGYSITAKDIKTGEVHTYNVSYDDWSSLEYSQEVTLKVVLGNAEVVKD